jgi:hypothetical protein
MTACSNDNDPEPPVFHGPANLRTTGGGLETAVDITWDVVEGATGYKLYQNSTFLRDVAHDLITSVSISGLTAFTPVMVGVTAMKGEEESNRSSIRVMSHGLTSGTSVPLGNTLSPATIVNANSARLFFIPNQNTDLEAGTYQIGLINPGEVTVYLMKGSREVISSWTMDPSNEQTMNAGPLATGRYSLIVQNKGSSPVTVQTGMRN